MGARQARDVAQEMDQEQPRLHVVGITCSINSEGDVHKVLRRGRVQRCRRYQNIAPDASGRPSSHPCRTGGWIESPRVFAGCGRRRWGGEPRRMPHPPTEAFVVLTVASAASKLSATPSKIYVLRVGRCAFLSLKMMRR